MLTKARMLLLAVGCSVVSVTAAEPITFKDQRDRTVTLDGVAERVVTIPIPAASLFMSVDGGTSKLVGMHPLSKGAIKGEILQNDDIIDPLTNAGLNVALIKIGTEEFTRRWLTMMGAVTGNEEKAAQMISWRDDVKAELQGETDKIADNERPRVLYFMNYLSKLRVAGGESYNNFYINLAGGTNAAAELGMFVDVGPEQVIEWDPEVILLNGFEKKLSPEDVYNNPLFAELSAVKNRRVYKMPLGGYRWDPPNQESPLTWLWLSMVLHPERFDWDLPARIDTTYKTMYGQGVTAENIKSILRFSMNKDAANYDIFSPDKP